MADKKIPEINAGSMADIAFLLLVFFLVTTTIQTDAGLNQILPQWVEGEQEDKNAKPKNARNVLQIKITAGDQIILIAGKEAERLDFPVEDIKQKTIDFLTNNGRSELLSEKPLKAAIVFQHDQGTSYNTYVRALNGVMSAYNTIWEQAARDKHGVSYNDLDKDKQKEIRDMYPRQLAEPDPTKFGATES